jgi:hypothetical protein
MITRTNDPPRRTVDKQEAIRHLIHTAIRLIAKGEDPFAIHVLIQAADKMLIDMGKKLDKELHFDWEWYVKPEFYGKFFTRHRAIYNYFKHADQDFDEELPIGDMMRVNILPLSICSANYNQLFGECTVHMWMYSLFVMALYPEIIISTTIMGAKALEGIPSFERMTSGEYFEKIQENPSMFPRLIGEVSKDVEDIKEFYLLSFAELRAGKTKRDGIFRIREY